MSNEGIEHLRFSPDRVFIRVCRKTEIMFSAGKNKNYWCQDSDEKDSKVFNRMIYTPRTGLCPDNKEFR